MGRTIELVFRGIAERPTLARVTRDRLYGHARRIGLDPADRECGSALLTRDGGHVLGPGGTAGLYLDKRGDAVAREDLAENDDGDGCPARSASVDQGPVEVSGPVSAEALLMHAATAIYAVAGLDPTGLLVAALASGDVFQVPLSALGLRSSACFLLANEHGTFLVAAEPVRFEFVGQDMPPPSENDSSDESDDLGFDEVGGAR